MDQIASLGTAIATIAPPTFKIYGGLLQQNGTAIKSTPRKSFSYGSHPRQQLDVYYPSSDSTQSRSSSPILIFAYGGGLVRGDKILPNIPDELVHANIGHFFASNYGYTVVIPNYRLISHGAGFPSGGQDLALTVEWVISNLPSSGAQGDAESGSKNSSRELYMMGNSAGGIHLCTFLFTPDFDETRAKILPSSPPSSTGPSSLRLTKVIELSVPFHFRAATSDRASTLETYYGSSDLIARRCPLGLLRSVSEHQGGVSKLLPDVKFLVLNGSLDPQDEILGPRDEFVAIWKGKGKNGEVVVDIMEGQNHISPPLSLGTGDGREEAWGRQVARFCNS